MMELKLFFEVDERTINNSYNRTMMELKLFCDGWFKRTTASYNRTMMELKSAGIGLSVNFSVRL